MREMRNPGQMTFDFSDLEEEPEPVAVPAIGSVQNVFERYVAFVPREIFASKKPWQAVSIDTNERGEAVVSVVAVN